MAEINVLIACEESQRVCTEFRKLGAMAFSCDIKACSGGKPEWHILGDCLELLKQPACFTTQDGMLHRVEQWDLVIAHPPCTYLTNTGNRWFNVERYGEKAIKREQDRKEAAEFFMRFVGCANHVAIENPIGYMSTHYRKPDQIIQPYYFGDAERKSTCLWLHGLPKLIKTNIVKPKIIQYQNGNGTDSPWHMESMSLPPEERAAYRSKTFIGIARAMADQWYNYLLQVRV